MTELFDETNPYLPPRIAELFDDSIRLAVPPRIMEAYEPSIIFLSPPIIFDLFEETKH